MTAAGHTRLVGLTCEACEEAVETKNMNGEIKKRHMVTSVKRIQISTYVKSWQSPRPMCFR